MGHDEIELDLNLVLRRADHFLRRFGGRRRRGRGEARRGERPRCIALHRTARRARDLSFHASAAAAAVAAPVAAPAGAQSLAPFRSAKRDAFKETYPRYTVGALIRLIFPRIPTKTEKQLKFSK